jgi:hypothetical protein
MRRLSALSIMAGALAGLLLIGCVKIQTGPQTSEDAVDAAAARGKELRVKFAAQMQNAGPEDQVLIWRTFVDSSGASYFQYGEKIADEWRRGSEGRGSNISDEEMLQTVEKWNRTQQPLIKANEDVVEFGVDHVKRSGAFGSQVLEPMSRLRDQFYALYSTVFFPKGSPEEYHQNVQAAQAEFERRSLDLERAMGSR